MFEIVHDESVKVYPHMYNGNVQQNPLCVESCVTKEFSVSPRFSPAFFYPDADSVLLRAHLCTAVDSMRRQFGTPEPKLMHLKLSDSVGLVPVFKFQEPRGSGVDEALVVWSLGGE